MHFWTRMNASILRSKVQRSRLQHDQGPIRWMHTKLDAMRWVLMSSCNIPFCNNFFIQCAGLLECSDWFSEPLCWFIGCICGLKWVQGFQTSSKMQALLLFLRLYLVSFALGFSSTLGSVLTDVNLCLQRSSRKRLEIAVTISFTGSWPLGYCYVIIKLSKAETVTFQAVIH